MRGLRTAPTNAGPHRCALAASTGEQSGPLQRYVPNTAEVDKRIVIAVPSILRLDLCEAMAGIGQQIVGEASDSDCAIRMARQS